MASKELDTIHSSQLFISNGLIFYWPTFGIPGEMPPTTDIVLLVRSTCTYFSIPQTIKLFILESPFSATTFDNMHYHEESSLFPADMSELLDILPNTELSCEAMTDFRKRNDLYKYCRNSDYSSNELYNSETVSLTTCPGHEDHGILPTGKKGETFSFELRFHA